MNKKYKLTNLETGEEFFVEKLEEGKKYAICRKHSPTRCTKICTESSGTNKRILWREQSFNFALA